MAAPNYEQIQSFGAVSEQLRAAALDEFAEYLYEGITQAEVIDVAVSIAQKYSMLGSELGAQWYDLCSQLAGLDVEPAELSTSTIDTLDTRAGAFAEAVDAAATESLQAAFNGWLQNEINNSIRLTGSANLWRDYERGKAPGKWARVPVGDTCAWCLMLASQGAWYLSEESALGKESGHYHDACNCIAVYHADAESISGYSKLDEYKSMYYDAENLRMANRDPYNDYEYPEELQDRITRAKAAHIANYEAEETDKKWTVYNEDLIIMRYKYGLK